MDGGRTAPARQQTGVDVQATAFGRVQHRLRQDQAVGHDHRHIGVQGGEIGLRLRVPQADRMAHGQAQRQRALMHGGRRFLLAASCGARRLAIDGTHLMPRVHQRIQHRDREIGRAHENHPHARFLARRISMSRFTLRQVVEIHPPCQMVDLVLHGCGPEADEIPLFDRAALVEKAHQHRAGAADRGRDAGQVGAGFFMVAQLDRGMDDFGIGHAHGLPALVRGIDHGKPQHHADLGRGKADAGHRLHRVDHVGPDRADVIGDRGHIRRRGPQPRVGPGDAAPCRHAGRTGKLTE